MRDQIKGQRAVGWFAAPVVGSGGRRRAALCYQSWRVMMCRMFMNDQCSINRMFKNKRWKKILSKFIQILILIFLIWSSSFGEFGPKSRFYNQDFLRKWVSPPNFRYGCMAKFLINKNCCLDVAQIRQYGRYCSIPTKHCICHLRNPRWLHACNFFHVWEQPNFKVWSKLGQ